MNQEQDCVHIGLAYLNFDRATIRTVLVRAFSSMYKGPPDDIQWTLCTDKFEGHSGPPMVCRTASTDAPALHFSLMQEGSSWVVAASRPFFLLLGELSSYQSVPHLTIRAGLCDFQTL